MQGHPKLFLEAEYLRRKQKNPAYSLRAFSRLLDIPSGRVSQLLSEKRKITPELGQKIARQLSFDPARTNEFLASIRETRKKNTPVPAPASSPSFAELAMDQFEAIADPMHFAILSLLETNRCEGTVKEVSQKLGLDAVEARSALERLERVGLIVPKKNGYTLKNAPGLATPNDVISSALKVAHRKVLEESVSALEEVAIELRDITSITMAIDPRKLPEAKQRLKELRRSLSAFLETGKRTEVYRLNVQLVPVTKRKKA